MATSKRGNTARESAKATNDEQVLVEEKVVKFNGDVTIKKYIRGKFLGKGGFAKCYEFTNM